MKCSSFVYTPQDCVLVSRNSHSWCIVGPMLLEATELREHLLPWFLFPGCLRNPKELNKMANLKPNN